MRTPGRLRWLSTPFLTQANSATTPGRKTAWTYSGAANNWAGMSVDEQARHRLCSHRVCGSQTSMGPIGRETICLRTRLLALNADTGKRIWHFQFVHHDIWDRDLPCGAGPGDRQSQRARRRRGGPNHQAGICLFSLSGPDGQAAVSSSRSRQLSGHLILRVSSRRRNSRCRLLPAPFARQKLTADMITTRTPEAHQEALDRFHEVAQRRAVHSREHPGNDYFSLASMGERSGAEAPLIRRPACST